MFSQYWKKINQLIRRCHDEIEKLVREMVEKMKEKYGDKLDEAARELNYNYTLNVETHNENPLLVYPVMYVDREELIPEIEEKLSWIVSQAGLRVKPQPTLIPYHKIKNKE